MALVHEMERMLTCRDRAEGDFDREKWSEDSQSGREGRIHSRRYGRLCPGHAAQPQGDRNAACAAKDVPVYEIGDCVRAAKVYEAMKEGYLAAMSIV